MSFRVVCPLPSCNRSPHFHDTKTQDDQAESGKTAIAYDLQTLDIEKINHAFQKFAKNPNAIGRLGWGVLQKPYAFNASGLTAYLLEQGGVFNLTSYKRNDMLSKFMRTVFYTGSLFGTFNWYSTFRFQQWIDSPEGFPKIRNINVIGYYLLLLAHADTEKIRDLSLNTLTEAGMIEVFKKWQDPDFHQTLSEDQILAVNKWIPLQNIAHEAAFQLVELEKIYPYPNITPEVEEKMKERLLTLIPHPRKKNYGLIVPSLIGPMRKARHTFSTLSKVAFVAAAGSLACLYAQRRFIQCNFESSDDLERLVVSAQEEEAAIYVKRWDQIYFQRTNLETWYSTALNVSIVIGLGVAYKKRSTLRSAALSLQKTLFDR